MRIKVSGIETVCKKLQAAAATAKNKVKSQLLHDLRRATPVDTGEARGGWQMREGCLINDVPHIATLNEGSSDQAPAHFIERTVLAHPNVRPNGIIVENT